MRLETLVQIWVGKETASKLCHADENVRTRHGKDLDTWRAIERIHVAGHGTAIAEWASPVAHRPIWLFSMGIVALASENITVTVTKVLIAREREPRSPCSQNRHVNRYTSTAKFRRAGAGEHRRARSRYAMPQVCRTVPSRSVQTFKLQTSNFGLDYFNSLFWFKSSARFLHKQYGISTNISSSRSAIAFFTPS